MIGDTRRLLCVHTGEASGNVVRRTEDLDGTKEDLFRRRALIVLDDVWRMDHPTIVLPPRDKGDEVYHISCTNL